MLIYEKRTEDERHLVGTLSAVPSEDDANLVYKDQDDAEIQPTLDKKYFNDGKGGIKDEEGNAVNVFIGDTCIIPPNYVQPEPPTPEKVLLGIEVVAEGTKEFEEGAEFNIDGLKVEAKYSDDTTEDVTEKVSTVPTIGAILTPENTEVVITFEDKTCSYAITVIPKNESEEEVEA